MSELPAARAERRAEIERALARYPHLSPEGVAELADYFTREASALDVGLIACNEDLTGPYRQFRETHLDPLRPGDWLRGAAFAMLTGAGLVALLWRGV